MSSKQPTRCQIGALCRQEMGMGISSNGFLVVFAVVLVCLLSATAQAHPAWGIVVDHEGQVYFSDLKTVWKIDAQGKLSIFRAADDRHTHELNIDEAGNVYGVDNSYDSATQRFFTAIWKMTPGGSFSYLLAPTEFDQLPKGIGMWRDRDGNTYSIDENNQLKRETLLWKRSPDGQVTVLAGGSYGYADGKGSQAKFTNINSMAYGPDGSLYLTAGSNVCKVNMDGAVTTLARNIAQESKSDNQGAGTSLYGIVVDAQGNSFVADYGNQRIIKITLDRQLTTMVRSEESWFPTGVALKGNELYVLEGSHTPDYKPIGTRVRKLSPDGKIVVLAAVGDGAP